MTTRYWYWIKALDKQEDGSMKPYLIMGGISESDSRQKAREMLPSTTWELIRLPTSNLQRASSLLKGSRLAEYHSLKEAGKKLGHERSARRRLHTQHHQQGTPIW